MHININDILGNIGQFTTRPSQPFSDEEIAKVESAIENVRKSCLDRCEHSQVVSRVVKMPTGVEYEVVIYDDGIPDSAARIYRDMGTGQLTFTAVLGTITTEKP